MGAVVSFSAEVSFETVTCYLCGVEFGVPAFFRQKRLEDHETFYCPNGHSQHYTAKTEAQRLREELEKERSRHAFTRNELDATQKQKTKLEKRIGGGACPCCKRNFTNLSRHMKSKHPTFGKEKKP